MNKEYHPYISKHSDFTRTWKHLIIGTFPPKLGCKERTDLFPFFYGNKGSLWDIVKETRLYPNYDFNNIDEIRKWLIDHSIGITDVLTSCCRKFGKECSPADSNLIVDYKTDLNLELKKYIINNINNIEKLYFTSGSEDNNSNSAYFLFTILMGNEMKMISPDKLIKLPSPSGEFLRTVFSKSKSNFGLKPYFYKFLEENYSDALEVAEKTFKIKTESPKTRVNRNGKTVKVTIERFPNCPNYPSLYRIQEYIKYLPQKNK
jgi:hypothetical protein